MEISIIIAAIILGVIIDHGLTNVAKAIITFSNTISQKDEK